MMRTIADKGVQSAVPVVAQSTVSDIVSSVNRLGSLCKLETELKNSCIKLKLLCNISQHHIFL